MSRLEIIHLRSSGVPIESLGLQIRESLRTVGKDKQVEFYRREGLVTDVAVHIRHLGPIKKKGPSRLGLQLASALRAFGLVEHTLWQEL